MTDRERKVIFLGDGGAGKTSLINRIVYNQFDERAKMTDGIRMTNWTTDIEGEPFTLRFMDFGGQEIMHAMHRCFLTKHTVYVIVCESCMNTDIDNIAARWLEMVKTFAPNCPVILALNKADIEPYVSVNETDLRTRFRFLRRVLRTSAVCERGERYGTDGLLWEIKEAALDRDILDSEMNENWLGVKHELEEMRAPYITSKAYRTICERYAIVERSEQGKALERFRDLGVVYFYETDEFDPSFESIRVLNPAWLINGMYRLILRTPATGFLPHKIIRETLKRAFPGDISQDNIYNAEETEFILHVMRKFEISLSVGNGVEMIPMKMPKTPSEKAYDFPRDDSLHLRWEARYLPNNLIHRLIIRKYSELDPELSENAVWLTGGRFYQKTTECKALVEMNDKGLDLYVTGMDGRKPERRLYMESFRSEILHILDAMNLSAKEFIIVVFNGKEGKIAYQDVMEQYYQHPEQKIFISGALEYISPEKLLQETYYYSGDELRQYREKRDSEARKFWKETERISNETRNLSLRILALLFNLGMILLSLLFLTILMTDLREFLISLWDSFLGS